jgi:glycosyltransferase involved in cell wall biosynthesis
MNILFLTDNFPPESNAPANRTYEHCLEWINKGAKVTVITCAPNFPKGKIFAGYKNKLYQTEEMNGIKVIRVWSYMSGNAGVLRRTLDYISFGLMAFFVSLFVKTDILIATTPQFFTAFFGYLAAFFKRKPWIMEVRDLWPESIKAVDAIKQNKVIDFLEKIELFLYRRATRIVVVTDSFKENISSRGISKGKIDVVKNGVILKQYPILPKSESLLKQHNLENKFIVGYMGTHGLAHKLDFILECATLVKDPDIHFVFVGNGAKREELLKQKKRLHLDNVSLLPSVTKLETKEFISIFDVSLVNLRKNKTFKTVIPSKIFENAAMGKPILLGLEGESKQIINHFEAGICFEPENKFDFINKLLALKEDKKAIALYRDGALKMAQAFNRSLFAIQMLTIIKKVVFGSSSLIAINPKYQKKN